jgi:hypothetical protein
MSNELSEKGRTPVYDDDANDLAKLGHKQVSSTLPQLEWSAERYVVGLSGAGPAFLTVLPHRTGVCYSECGSRLPPPFFRQTIDQVGRSSHRHQQSWVAMSASMSIALPSGGPTAVIWGVLVSGLGSLAMAASLAEICSAYPVCEYSCLPVSPVLFSSNLLYTLLMGSERAVLLDSCSVRAKLPRLFNCTSFPASDNLRMQLPAWVG